MPFIELASQALLLKPTLIPSSLLPSPMATLEIQTPHSHTTTTTKLSNPEKCITTDGNVVDEDELSPLEQIRLTVSNTDDLTLPVWTFRMWALGLISCALLSFLNQFFAYQTKLLFVTKILSWW